MPLPAFHAGGNFFRSWRVLFSGKGNPSGTKAATLGMCRERTQDPVARPGAYALDMAVSYLN